MDIVSIVNRAAEKAGFARNRFKNADIPTSMSNICIFPFFGNVRSSAIMSMLLLKRYREMFKGSKYFILCSWPGYEDLFPFVDEYWSPKDGALLKNLYLESDNFSNDSAHAVAFLRNINQFFEDVVDVKEFEQFYNNGLQQGFWDKFMHVKRYLPAIPTLGVLGPEFSRQFSTSKPKVFLYPSIFAYFWRYGKLDTVRISKEFWIEVVGSLLKSGITPVLHKNYLSYDLSQEFVESCIYLNTNNISHVLATMRGCNCVVDMFNQVSRLAIIARAPYIVFDERGRYNGQKEYEIDDLCSLGLPKNYIFSNSTLLENSARGLWKSNFIDLLSAKVESMVSQDYDLPNSSESLEVVPYSVVRERKLKKMGIRFIPKKS